MGIPNWSFNDQFSAEGAEWAPHSANPIINYITAASAAASIT